jgi:hypothetical protein
MQFSDFLLWPRAQASLAIQVALCLAGVPRHPWHQLVVGNQVKLHQSLETACAKMFK